MQVSHDDKGNTTVSFIEAIDVSQPARVQQVPLTVSLPHLQPVNAHHPIMWPSLRTLCVDVQLLDRAMRQRSVGATAMNEQSSRSHMVFMLQLRGANELSGQRVSGACFACLRPASLLGRKTGSTWPESRQHRASAACKSANVSMLRRHQFALRHVLRTGATTGRAEGWERFTNLQSNDHNLGTQSVCELLCVRRDVEPDRPGRKRAAVQVAGQR